MDDFEPTGEASSTPASESNFSAPEFDFNSAIDSIATDLFEKEAGEGGVVAPKVEVTQAPASEPAAPKVEPTAQPETSDLAPKTWRKEAQAEWSALTPTLKAEIAKREDDMHRGIEQYKGKAQIGEAFEKIINPHMGMLSYHKIDPAQHVSGLLDMYHQLATGDVSTKTQILSNIANMFNIDPLTLGNLEASYVDPALQAVQQELRELKSSQAQQQTHAAQAAQTHLMSQIETFASDPANIYFADLQEDMTQLLQSGMAKDLPSAYAKALKLNDTVQAKETSRLKALEAQTAAEKVAKAQQAKSANLRTTPKNASATTPLGSIDDTLTSTLAAIRART